MKKIIFFGLLMAVSCSVSAQNVKIKNDNITYKYDVYREIEGFDEHKFYHVIVNDFNGVNYEYTEGLDERAKKCDIIFQGGAIYGKKWNFLRYQLMFDIKLNTTKLNDKEVLSFVDEATKVKKYAYKISGNQTYTVKILDAQNNNTLIKEFNVEYDSQTAWPGYPSATVGYNSPQLLEANFKHSQETVEGFFKKIDAGLIYNAYSKAIVPELKMAISDIDKRLLYFSTKVKTKDTKFDLLDSALIYIEAGMEEIKKNEKAGIKGNHHVQNAKAQFLSAHRIYTEYTNQEYIDYIEDADLKEEYFWGMKSNLYLANFLIADYQATNKIYNEIRIQVDSENEAKKNNPEGIRGILKRSPAQKALDAANEFRPMELREVKLYNVFKERFGY